jgi:hypothetical protein
VPNVTSFLAAAGFQWNGFFKEKKCAAETKTRIIPAQLYDEICKYALYFVGFAVVSSLVTAGMIIAYDIVGEKLTTNLRERTFQYVYLPKRLVASKKPMLISLTRARAGPRCARTSGILTWRRTAREPLLRGLPQTPPSSSPSPARTRAAWYVTPAHITQSSSY